MILCNFIGPDSVIKMVDAMSRILTLICSHQIIILSGSEASIPRGDGIVFNQNCSTSYAVA